MAILFRFLKIRDKNSALESWYQILPCTAMWVLSRLVHFTDRRKAFQKMLMQGRLPLL